MKKFSRKIIVSHSMVPFNNLLPFKSQYFFMFLLEVEKTLAQGVTKVIRVTIYFQQTQKEISLNASYSEALLPAAFSLCCSEATVISLPGLPMCCFSHLQIGT